MSSSEPKSGSKDSIYKGLYPIREVKQYYRREFVNQKALYLCLLCDFKTWKYSQHIARHIHLKHIGIKELKCEEPNCGKTFKRPESLVQHQKNHLCGFGIDSAKMKDPNNVCGVKNIKKFYFRELDNDYYVFGCKWTGCEFVTNNSGSIRRHVHNQHLCPHAVATNGNSNGNSGDNNHRHMSPESDNNFSINDIMQPMIEIIEMDVNPQSLAMKSDDSDFNPFTISAVESELDDNLNDQSSTGGLYSLKNYSELYSKVLIDGQIFFRCNCTDFTTKNQISLVRHIWTHIGRSDYECDINGCNAKFDSENNLSKHKKTEHNYNLAKSDDQNGSINNFSDFSEIAGTSGLNTNIDFTAFPQTLSALINGSSSLNYSQSGAADSQSAQQTVAGLLALQNMSQYFLKNLNDNSNANQNIPILPNNKNFDNSYANNLTNFFDESISSIESLREDMSTGKSNGFKRSFGSDRNNSGLYSLKNYDKYYSKVKVNEEFTYKCTNCGFCSRSQVSLIRHIWTHTGMNSFECDITGCTERFNSETELYRHRKTHTNHPVSTTPPTIYPAINANIRPVSNVLTNGSTDMQKTGKIGITGSAIRKIMESKPERGLYSLKKYENFYKKVQTDQGFKFYCNCDQFETKSQATLVRHIWEHQSSQRANNDSFENELNGFENMSQTSNDFELSANESTGRRDSRSIGDLEIDEDFEELDNEIGFDAKADNMSDSSPNQSLKKLKTSENNEKTNGSDGKNSNELSAEEVYLNSLIVEIEDRGYFCQWPECEFSDEGREPVVLHIKQMHNNLGNSIMESTLEVDEENDGSYEDSDPEQNFPLLQEFCESGEQNLNQFQCEYNYCNASFPSFDSLEEHKKIHSDFNLNPDYYEDSIDEDMMDMQDMPLNSSGSNGRVIKSWKSYSYNGKTSAQNADKYSDSVPQPDGSFIYKCKWINCGYQSPVRGNIIRHIRRHTGDKPFICELNGCGRTFAYSTDVKQHQQKEH